MIYVSVYFESINKSRGIINTDCIFGRIFCYFFIKIIVSYQFLCLTIEIQRKSE